MARRDDLTRLIQFSLDKYKFETAVVAFPMFTRAQIQAVYSMSEAARKRLLRQRTSDDSLRKQYRNREQAQKMAEIATDRSNR